MSMDRKLDRRHFLGATAATAAAGALGPLGAAARPRPRTAGAHPPGANPGGRKLPPENIGIQLYTLRNFLEDDLLDLPGTLEMVADAGYASVEIGGTYDGRTPSEFRRLTEERGMRVIGSHVPGGHGAFRSNLSRVLDEAEELGLRYVGIAIPDGSVPRTHDGYRALAEEFNAFGAAARRRGLKFYFHNHPDDFTLDNGTPVYDTLVAETEPDKVWFELDIAWIEAGGQSAYDYIADNPRRYPLFHVKDLRWNPNGARVTPGGVAGAGRRFDLVAVGKGDIDFARVFGALRSVHEHHFLVEDDDAPFPDRNPAGGANTAWFSCAHLRRLRTKKTPKGRH